MHPAGVSAPVVVLREKIETASSSIPVAYTDLPSGLTATANALVEPVGGVAVASIGPEPDVLKAALRGEVTGRGRAAGTESGQQRHGAREEQADGNVQTVAHS